MAQTRPRPQGKAGRAFRRDGRRHPSRQSVATRCAAQINVSVGWGTNLTNDFKGCAPAGVDGDLAAISLVCKVVEADGRPAVKLSDNPNKVMGPRDEIARYLRVFGAEGMSPSAVTI